MRRVVAFGFRCAVLSLGLTLASAAQAQSTRLGTPTRPIFLNQAWKVADRAWFYTTTQGSQIMPYKWFLALERPDSDMRFRADSLARFGYLPNRYKTDNPDGLPVGFVKDTDDRGAWIGMTCAACHTNQINFAGKTLQIDGGPANADMFALIKELGAALARTAANRSDPKFQRFAASVLGAGRAPEDEENLFDDLKEFSGGFDAYVTASTSKVAWGPARLDAFGMIFNRATAIDLNLPGNSHEPDAPVSYPFLWDTSWHDKVQWNGSAPNVLVMERLARNVGEVLGVFAHTDIKKTILPPLFFQTSAKRTNQLLIEARLKQLRSPAWPRKWAPIDAKKAAAGKELYRAHCAGCHEIVARSEDNRSIKVKMTPLAKLGTDPKMATNAATLESKSGVLKGVRMPLLPLVPPIKATETSFALVGHIVVGAILAPPDWLTPPSSLDAAQRQLVSSIAAGRATAKELPGDAQALSGNLAKQAKAFLDKRSANVAALAYKARPLDGIWATAPYLHNGSVPNLYQLLLPAAQRDATFHVGSREFDPVNVGFKIDSGFLFDTSIAGNRNTGHDGPTYATDRLSDEQRWQLVEYLKTL
jgi:hypothetical protein